MRTDQRERTFDATSFWIASGLADDWGSPPELADPRFRMRRFLLSARYPISSALSDLMKAGVAKLLKARESSASNQKFRFFVDALQPAKTSELSRQPIYHIWQVGS
jgi:hypothetical protein